MRTHPDIGLMTARNKPAADLLQLARFWLCTGLRRFDQSSWLYGLGSETSYSFVSFLLISLCSR